MKINKMNKKNMCAIEEINYGDCFIWKGDVYIQVNDPFRPYCAVSLSTGELVEFEDSFEPVVPVKAEVNIEEGE